MDRDVRIELARRRNSRPLRALTDVELLAVSHLAAHASAFRADVQCGLDSLGDLASYEVDTRLTNGEE